MTQLEIIHIAQPNQRVFLRDIEKAVCANFKYLTPAILKSPLRSRNVARPRQIAYYLARQLTAQSFPQIGCRFNRDHSTVLYGARRIAALIESNPKIRNHVETVAGILAAQRMESTNVPTN